MKFDLLESPILTEQEKSNKKKSIREMIIAALGSPLSPEIVNDFKERGVGSELADEEFNVLFAMIMGQAQHAAYKGNTHAFKELLEYLKDDEKDNIGKLFELPATILGKEYVDVHRSILAHEYSEYIFKGGRLALKSSSIALFIVEIIKQNPKFHALAVRPFENTLRDSVYAQFMWAISEIDDTANWKFTTSPMQCEYLPTGQKIYLRGADDPGKIKSIKPPFGHIAVLWFEELDQFRGEEQIRDVTQSAIRGGDVGYVFKSFNPPRSRSSWANRYAVSGKPNMLVHHSTYLDVPRNWIGRFALDEAELLKELNEKAYRHEYLGEPVGDGANVFENVVLREITDDEIAHFSQQYFGQDWGWFPDPNVLIVNNFDANRRVLHIYDEISGNKQSNETWAERIKKYIMYQITADSAEQKTIADMRTMGYSMQGAIKGPGSVAYSMKWLASLTEIVIDPVRCPGAAKEFMNYEHDKTKDGEIISTYPDKDNHRIDAVRYALERIWRKSGM